MRTADSSRFRKAGRDDIRSSNVVLKLARRAASASDQAAPGAGTITLGEVDSIERELKSASRHGMQS